MSYASSTSNPDAFIQGQNTVGTNFTKTAVGAATLVTTTPYTTVLSLSAGVWAITPSYNFASNDDATLLTAAEIKVSNASATPYTLSTYYNIILADGNISNLAITQIVNVVDYEVNPVNVVYTAVFSGATTAPSLSGVVNCIRIA